MYSKSELQNVTKSAVGRTIELLSDKIEKIILYGSYARGDFTSESDIDIMVLLNCEEEELWQYREEISKIASRISLENDIEVSLLLKSKTFFEKWEDILPFYQNIRKEGVVLYGQQGD